jgi:hypothetical protein
MTPKRKFISAGFAFLAAVGVYLFSIGFWVIWQQKAPTLDECARRARVTQTVYAPIVWLERVDPTKAVEKAVRGYAALWQDPSFHPDRLPPK